MAGRGLVSGSWVSGRGYPVVGKGTAGRGGAAGTLYTGRDYHVGAIICECLAGKPKDIVRQMLAEMRRGIGEALGLQQAMDAGAEGGFAVQQRVSSGTENPASKDKGLPVPKVSLTLSGRIGSALA